MQAVAPARYHMDFPLKLWLQVQAPLQLMKGPTGFMAKCLIAMRLMAMLSKAKRA